MGIFWFRNKIYSTKILVCSVGDENLFKSEVDIDASVYTKYYRYLVKKTALDGKSLIALIKTRKFHIVHILARVDSQGYIGGIHVNEFHYICGENNIKLVFWASNNDEDVYTNYFKPSYFNLVFTLDRRGQCFSNFLDGLLFRMSAGKTMPKSWIGLMPQTEMAPEHESAPDCIFHPNSSDVIFLP